MDGGIEELGLAITESLSHHDGHRPGNQFPTLVQRDLDNALLVGAGLARHAGLDVVDFSEVAYRIVGKLIKLIPAFLHLQPPDSTFFDATTPYAWSSRPLPLSAH